MKNKMLLVGIMGIVLTFGIFLIAVLPGKKINQLEHEIRIVWTPPGGFVLNGRAVVLGESIGADGAVRAHWSVDDHFCDLEPEDDAFVCAFGVSKNTSKLIFNVRFQDKACPSGGADWVLSANMHRSCGGGLGRGNSFGAVEVYVNGAKQLYILKGNGVMDELNGEFSFFD